MLYDILLLSGDNVVVLDITDTAANTNTVDINVGVDLIIIHKLKGQVA